VSSRSSAGHTAGTRCHNFLIVNHTARIESGKRRNARILVVNTAEPRSADPLRRRTSRIRACIPHPRGNSAKPPARRYLGEALRTRLRFGIKERRFPRKITLDFISISGNTKETTNRRAWLTRTRVVSTRSSPTVVRSQKPKPTDPRRVVNPLPSLTVVRRRSGSSNHTGW